MNVPEQRPKLKIPLTRADKFLEFVSLGVLLTTWAVVILNYANLPDRIPTHYNISGVVDGYGGKSSILMLPFIATILFVGMTILNKFPHVFNYLTTITEDNALRQYTIATGMMRYMKFIFTIIYGFQVFKTIQIVMGESKELGNYFTPLVLGLIIIPLIYYIYALSRKK